MLTTEIIAAKRDGVRLTESQIRQIIGGFTDGTVADYQMAALAMAICIHGMDAEESAWLTSAMLDSGDRLPRDGDRPRLDKHSTGGLGDKISLILAPLWAACGVDVPMISGRGLGITGGTLDKLESIDGFTVNASPETSSRWLADVGAFIISADESLAPADRRLYALRDVTATVESVSLITASILSKKLAASLDALVMDVKVGRGAFMTNLESARRLAESLINVGRRNGLPIAASITDMEQPLGWAVGNAIEVNESLAVLDGQPGPVRDLTLHLAARGLTLIRGDDPAEASKTVAGRLDDGSARERFDGMVAVQGGRLAGELTLAPEHVVAADRSGHVAAVDARAIGLAVIESGGGRRKVGDPLDHSAGVHVHVRVGDAVDAGDRLLTLHANDAADGRRRLADAVRVVDGPVEPRKLVIETLGVGDE